MSPAAWSGLDADPGAMAPTWTRTGRCLAEPIQSAMRALAAQGVPGMANPYERLREFSHANVESARGSCGIIEGWACPRMSRPG